MHEAPTFGAYCAKIDQHRQATGQRPLSTAYLRSEYDATYGHRPCGEPTSTESNACSCGLRHLPNWPVPAGR